jgi:uncharacterized protein
MRASHSGSNLSDKEQKSKSTKRLVLKSKVESAQRRNPGQVETLVDWIKLVPYGVSVGADASRPVVLLKVESSEEILPVPVPPLEAGVTLSQSSAEGLPSSPHRITRDILLKMAISIVRCEFCEIRGTVQYLDLHLESPAGRQLLRSRADEVMSLCLFLNAPLFATREFIRKSRVLNSELENLEKAVKSNPAILVRSHKYIM